MKLNCRYSAYPAHSEVVKAILSGLTQMPIGVGTFRPWRLIAYDRDDASLSSCGFIIRTDSSDYRCFGTTHTGVGYQTKAYSILGASENFSRILGDSSSFLINLSLLKEHNMYPSGCNYTLSMKNHLGNINNPASLHNNFRRQLPYLMRVIRDSLGSSKEKVFVIDALFVIYQNGPDGSPQEVLRTLVLSKDPVACDSMGVEMINNRRRAHGLLPENSRYLAYAESLGLGTRQYTLIRINNPSSGVAQETSSLSPSLGLSLFPGQPNPFSGTTEIAFTLPKPGIVVLEVYNTLGARVRILADKQYPAGRFSVAWDGKDGSGREVSSGVYLVRMVSGGAKIERSLSLVR